MMHLKTRVVYPEATILYFRRPCGSRFLFSSAFVFALLRKIPRSCCSACVGLSFVSAACAVSVLVVSGLRRFGVCFQQLCCVDLCCQRLASFRFLCFLRLSPFRCLVVSGLRRFGFLRSGSYAVLVRFCFVSITLIPAALAIVLFVYRGDFL
jgi:hypothetical protein